MLLSSLLLACLQSPAPAPAAPAQAAKPLSFVPRLETGAKSRLELVKAREDWEGDKLLKSSKTVTPITVEVLAHGATGGVVRWTFGHTSVIEGAGKDKDYAERMASLSEGMRLDFKLSPAGEVQGLADPEELRRHYARMLQEVEQGLLEKGLEREVVARLMASSAQRVVGPDFERTSLLEVGLFHRCAGFAFVPGEKVEVENVLANPLGGDPLPAKGWYRLELADGSTARVRFELVLDAEKALALILAWWNEVAERNGEPPRQAPEELPLKDLSEETSFVLDLASGLPRSVEHVRTSRIDQRKRVDRTLLRLVSAAAPRADAKAGESPR